MLLLVFGDKLTIRHTGVNGYINYNSGALFITPATTNTANYLQLDGGEGLYLKHRFSNGGQAFALKTFRSGGVELYHSGIKICHIWNWRYIMIN